jgi:hypothetical protein
MESGGFSPGPPFFLLRITATDERKMLGFHGLTEDEYKAY